MSRYPGEYDDEDALEGEGRSPGEESIPDLSAESASADEQIAEQGSIIVDLDEQSQNIEDGILTMPLEVARDSVLRWADTLRSLGDPKLDQVATSLGELSMALDGPLEGTRIGSVLERLGLDVRRVADDRSGAMGMALDRLADGLTLAAQSLQREVH